MGTLIAVCVGVRKKDGVDSGQAELFRPQQDKLLPERHDGRHHLRVWPGVVGIPQIVQWVEVWELCGGRVYACLCCDVAHLCVLPQQKGQGDEPACQDPQPQVCRPVSLCTSNSRRSCSRPRTRLVMICRCEELKK